MIFIDVNNTKKTMTAPVRALFFVQIEALFLGNVNTYVEGDLCFAFFIMYNEVK